MKPQAWSRTAFSSLVLFLAAAASAQTSMQPRLSANVRPEGNVLEIAAEGLPPGPLSLCIETDGLKKPELGRDTGEPGMLYLPPREGPLDVSGTPPPHPPGAENIFFFNEFVDADGWHLVLRFPQNASGTWKLNGRFSLIGGNIMPEIAIPVHELEIGENLLHLEGPELLSPELFFRRRIAGGVSYAGKIILARNDWTGRLHVERERPDAETRRWAELSVANPAARWEAPAFRIADWSDRKSLSEAAIAVGRNVLAARVTNPRSFFAGGFNLVYDVDRRALRMPHWIWAWGPSIALLLELEKQDSVRGTPLSEEFHAAALAAARRSLAFEVTDPKHPAFGASTVRWEPSRAVWNGWVEYMSTSDSLFLAGWGWMSAYEATKDPVYLERTRKVASAAERLMGQYPVVPQDWVVQRERWTPHTLDESVFGMPGLLRLFEATKEPAVAALGRRYLDSHLRHMGRDDGLLARAWLRDEKRDLWDPDIKGHAWVLEGYLDGYRLTADPKYLALARQLTSRVLACQAENGGWGVPFTRPVAGDPIDDKGTAIWAYLLYDMHRVTGQPEYRDGARRALRWCLDHQVRSADPRLNGAIVNTNSMAYVRRRPMTILYTNTFFALALLEELKLSGAGVPARAR